MIEKRQIKNPDVATVPAPNGVDEVEITINDPLPVRLAELERRISTALTGDKTAHDLANLLMQCDLAVPQAEEFAKSELERALDPLRSPDDPREARQQAEDATFASNRLRTLRPRLLARYHEVSAAEQRQQYLVRYERLKIEGAALGAELADCYPGLVGPLVEVFVRLSAFREQTRALHLSDPGDGRPHLRDPELQARRLDGFTRDVPSLLESVHLHDWQSGREVWPPRQPAFAAEFVQSMTVPSVGAAWADPVVQERRRAEIAAEQERMSRHYATQAAEQQERRIAPCAKIGKLLSAVANNREDTQGDRNSALCLSVRRGRWHGPVPQADPAASFSGFPIRLGAHSRRRRSAPSGPVGGVRRTTPTVCGRSPTARQAKRRCRRLR